MGAGLGQDVAVRTYRLTGIGESQVADRLGETLLRATNPIVATYARVEAVDIRISGFGDGPAAAEALVEATARTILDELGTFVWATGDTTWSQAIGHRLGELGWTLSMIELGTGGQIAALFGDVPWLVSAERSANAGPDDTDVLASLAEAARTRGHSDVGLAVQAVERGGDTTTTIQVVTPTRAP